MAPLKPSIPPPSLIAASAVWDPGAGPAEGIQTALRLIRAGLVQPLPEPAGGKLDVEGAREGSAYRRPGARRG